MEMDKVFLIMITSIDAKSQLYINTIKYVVYTFMKNKYF